MRSAHLRLCIGLFALALTVFAACDGGGTGAPDAGARPDGLIGGGGDGGPCTNQCSLGAKQCSGAGWQACVKTTDGCTAWGKVENCTNGEICSGGVCRKSCVNQCTDGAQQCSGQGYVVCAKMTTGCTDWGQVQACTGGTFCSGGKCVGNCKDQCTVGAKQCSGTAVQTCQKMSSGCTDWGNGVPCKVGEVCSGGQCTTNCSNQCTQGATRCNGTNVQTCKKMPSGCTDWDTPAPCGTGTCVNGKCDSGSCLKGDVRCNGNNVEECDANGFWLTRQICPIACQTGKCTTTVQCTPSSRRCSGKTVEECNPSGTAWLYVRGCSLGCNGGLCTGGCTAGERRCNGNTAEVCKSDGSGFQTDQACSTFCTKGVCAGTSLLLDNTTKTMDGEHVFAGDVILKNNSLITVGPKGWLRIRAKTITIDATSSITAPAVGNDPTGKGAGGTKSCKHSYCSSSTSGSVVGHGGYGTSGSGESKRLYNCYRYSASRYCNISGTGGKANGGYILEIHMGSPGGGCSKPNGGGMIDLIATTSLSMAGSLKADGGTPTDGGGGACGYGSGGGIRVMSEDLSVTGVLSAAGSGGAGKGRIKLLYGSKKNVQATMNGVVEQSLIPPADLVSSTHPDPTKIYNDDFEFFNLAWSKPFSNLAGYFYKLSTSLPSSQSAVPGAQATWLTGESHSVQSTDLKVGQNYFNIVGVAPNATLGTTESAYGLRINDKAPTVSSSSHPSQSTWYTSGTAIFAWSDPVPAENVAAYYYVFDRYADTIPDKADKKLPATDKKLLMPNLPTSTIWYLHVIAEDTAGYLTKKASHFRVQVGPEPGKGGISGDIREKGSTPPTLLDGVEVSLNRGLFKTTSATGGQYFFSNNVYAGTYELRARKDGYEDFVAQVKVTAGGNTSLNIQMVKKPATP